MFRFDDVWPHLLRPPGGGIYTVSAGKGSAEALQRAHYAAARGVDAASLDAQAIGAHWRRDLGLLASAHVVVLGVPLDTGAGIRRGAMYGPRGVRAQLLDDATYCAHLASGAVVDIGDVFVNPHLLHDEMLSDAQITRSRRAMYADAPTTLRDSLPVSALSQTEVVVDALLTAHPHLRVFMIGGDHSTAWPVAKVLAARHKGTLGIVQPDAHTDLLPERLGVPYCFGTWSFHANDAIGRGGRMVQLGIRQTGRDRGHWESTTGVVQVWPKEIEQRGAARVIDDVVAHLRAVGVTHVYFSNDIDGTDEKEASATGTPAPDGLTSGFVLDVIGALSAHFTLVAADVVEVAPDLGTREESDATCRLAARYARACIEGMFTARDRVRSRSAADT